MGLQEIFEKYKPRGLRLSWDAFEDYVKKVKAELIERAKRRDVVAYSELMSRFRISRRDIGWVVGACSASEFEQGNPLLSAIVINKQKGTSGEGFWGLRGVPAELSRDKWERKGIAPPEDVERKRRQFWELQLNRVHDHWYKQGS